MSERSAAEVKAALDSIRQALKVLNRLEVERVREIEDAAEAIRAEFRRRELRAA